MAQNEQQPKPDSKKYHDLILELERGEIKIPQFQREFVWNLDRTAQLLDSVLKGYPIGTFVLWETKEKLSHVKNIGNMTLREPDEGSKVQYVLDGQQRITSVYAAFRGAKILQKGKKKKNDYSEIYVDLEADSHDNEAQIVVAKMPIGTSITLNEILNFNENFANMQKNFSEDYVKLIHQYSQMFATYDFSTVVLRKDDIDSAVEVFTRINTGGKTLELFDIISAKTYDEGKNFDMAEKFDSFLKKLREKGYGEIPRQIVLDVLSLIESGECGKKKILQLNKENIIRDWDKVLLAIGHAIDYFRSAYGVFNSSVLPYDVLIAPFAYFLFKKKKKNLTGKQISLLREFFWRAALSQRYVEGRGTKLAQDVKMMKLIMDGKRPTYDDMKADITSDALIGAEFSISNSFCKTILCLLASQEPRYLDNDERKVTLDDSFIVTANSKNYHHFFPKAFLRERDVKKGNSVVNITLVSADLNKEIRDGAPSKYIRTLRKINKKLPETLKSHLIEDIGGFGINDDDYNVFLQKRAEAICRELKKKINPES